jgi:predicted transcriptional regulator
VRSIEESLKSEQCRRILEALESGPKSTEELVKLTKLTAGSIAKHVNVLEVALLVKVSKSKGLVSKR